MKMYILIYGKRKRLTKENRLPIYLRVTINDLRYEVTTNRFVDLGKQSSDAGKVKGNTAETWQLNYYFDELKQKAYETQRSILAEEKALNIFIFKERWLDRDDTPHMLMQVIKGHIVRNTFFKLIIYWSLEGFSAVSKIIVVFIDRMRRIPSTE